MTARVDCVSCGRVMRPHRARAADHPGTVARANATTCAGCRDSAAPAKAPAEYVEVDAPCVLVRANLRPSTWRAFAARVGADNVAEALSRLADKAVEGTAPAPVVTRRRTRLSDEDRAQVRVLLDGGYSARDVAKSFRVSDQTIRNIAREATS